MSFDPVKIVVASELKQFEFNGIEITGFICKIIKKENRGETVSINMNFSIMMNCPTDRETDGRELCLKDRVKILNFKEICFKGRPPKKNTHGETNIGIDFGSVSIHFPLRWALESINGKGKKIGKDLMKRNKRVQFRSCSQGRSYPQLKTGCFLLDTHHRDDLAFSRIALHATFSIKLLFIPLILYLLSERYFVKRQPSIMINCLGVDMKPANVPGIFNCKIPPNYKLEPENVSCEITREKD
ncbi:hypothetical protein TNCV_290231 [Trichonephila clavipes]|nr:hypothetical protein TNCV_290231 [Trichonephila clavipes]